MQSINAWSAAVQSANADLVRWGEDMRKPRWKGLPNTNAGACYFQAEALAAILVWVGFQPTVWTVQHEGASHWFLKVGHLVVDPTYNQFSTQVPYFSAKRIGFLTKEPSRRARRILEVMGLDKHNLRVYPE